MQCKSSKVNIYPTKNNSACLSSIMRTYYSVIGVGSPDQTFNLVQVMLWR